jgi:hypothetical protein
MRSSNLKRAIASCALLCAASGVWAQAVVASKYATPRADIVEEVSFRNVLRIDLGRMTASLDGAAAVAIPSKALSLGAGLELSFADGALRIASTGKDPLAVELSGTLAGRVEIANGGPCEAILNGARVDSPTGAALSFTGSAPAYVVSAKGSVNALSDAKASALKQKGALYAKGPLILSGEGSIVVAGHFKHGIYSDDYIRVRSGAISVAVDARDAVRSMNGFAMDGGALSIRATGTAIDEESKGIKVDGLESAYGAGKGAVVISGGSLDIVSAGKAITAGWDREEDAKTAATSDDPDPDLLVRGGVLTIKTTSRPYEYVDSSGKTVSCSPEGIEAKSDLLIAGGTIEIRTADDCVNAGSSVTIAGGSLYCESSENDAIDSNGTLTISGGTIVALGGRGPEGAFDCDRNRFAVTGGCFIGLGGSTSIPTAEASTQNVIVIGGLRVSGGDRIGLKDSKGGLAFSYDIPAGAVAETIVVSTPGIAKGSYSLVSGIETSGGTAFMGFRVGPSAVKPGASLASATVASSVTTMGTVRSGLGGPGGRGGFGEPPEFGGGPGQGPRP